MAKIRYTRDGDALMVTLSDGVIDHGEEAGHFIVHTSADGEVVLIEVLDAREFVMGALASIVEEREVEIHEGRPCDDEAARAWIRSVMGTEAKAEVHAR